MPPGVAMGESDRVGFFIKVFPRNYAYVYVMSEALVPAPFWLVPCCRDERLRRFFVQYLNHVPHMAGTGRLVLPVESLIRMQIFLIQGYGARTGSVVSVFQH